MIPSKEKRLLKWGTTREKGMRRFILLDGAIGWGVPTAVMYSLVMWLISPGFHHVRDVVLALVVFPVAGVGWGWQMWRRHEAEFILAQKHQSP
jgi:hypothetical protein